MRRNASLALLLIITTAVLTLLGACGATDDELIIRSNIETMRESISQHQGEAFMRFIHENYKSPFHRNKTVLRKFLKHHLNRNRVIYIYIADIDVEINDDTAKVTFYSGTTGGVDQIPERGRLYKVGMHWLKTNGQWQVTQAKWRPALVLKKK